MHADKERTERELLDRLEAQAATILSLKAEVAKHEQRLRRLIDVGGLPDQPREEQSRRDRAAYGEANGRGEAQALRDEEHLCSSCLHTQVCEIASVVEPREGMMLVIYRCLAYLQADEVAEEGSD